MTAECLAPRAESLLAHQAKSEIVTVTSVAALGVGVTLFSRRRIVSKAVRFRAGACAA